jgi:large subunit ribosomal protein L19e
MNLSSKKAVAAKLLKVGTTRVRFHNDSLDRVSDAVTRDDIRKLIRAGDIWAVQKRGISRGRKKVSKEKRSKRGRGPGSKSGKDTTRTPPKRAWVNQVRHLRGYLKMLKKRGELAPQEFKRFYTKVKGGDVRTLRRLKELIAESRGNR